MFFGDGFPEYVSVAERRRRAARELEKLRRKGGHASPVVVEGRALASTVWGKAWCQGLESFSDFANRLPRGRTYVRNGQVVHLEVGPGKVKALVYGTELYEVEVAVKPLPGARWRRLVEACAGQVSSVVELLAGRLSEPVMEVLCRPGEGLFPLPRELSFSCTCPDFASMCKHVAAALYGVGTRLDTAPELLFTLRQVNGSELVTGAAEGLARSAPASGTTLEQGSDLAGMFGIELARPDARAESPPRGRGGAAREAAAKKSRAKKAAVKAPEKKPVERKAAPVAKRKQGPGSRKGATTRAATQEATALVEMLTWLARAARQRERSGQAAPRKKTRRRSR